MAEYGLSKSDRILKRSGFILLSRHGKRVQDRFFIMVYMPAESDRPRLGVTVSKRVGNAVTRNRLKRLIREYFRLNRGSISGDRGPWDINIIAKKEAAGIPSAEVFASLGGLFEKIGRG